MSRDDVIGKSEIKIAAEFHRISVGESGIVRLNLLQLSHAPKPDDRGHVAGRGGDDDPVAWLGKDPTREIGRMFCAVGDQSEERRKKTKTFPFLSKRPEKREEQSFFS